MDQNGPRGYQVGAAAASDDGLTTPPTPVACFSLMSAGQSYGNTETMDAGTSVGKKNLIPDLNKEEEERDSAGSITKGKPRTEAEVVEVPAADAGADKGKSMAAADDDGKLNANSIALERERRKRMKGLFTTLNDLMPHVPDKSDKVTTVEEAIQYIKFLEEKAAMLEKKKSEQALARQAAARGEASSSFSTTVMPQTAHGMAALCSSDAPRAGWGGVPLAAPAVPAPPVRFKTWSGQNIVLTMANDHAYISMCVPRRPKTLTMVMSVLDNHGIDVITTQISADSVRALFMIYAHVNRTNGSNRSSEEVYQRAVSEIIYRFHGSSNN